MTKADLRRKYRAIRKAYAAKLGKPGMVEAADHMRGLVETWFAHLGRELPKTIAGYSAVAGEVDPAPMLMIWREEGHTIALPYFASRASSMEFRESRGPLVSSPTSKATTIWQPRADNTALDPDLVLVPLIAATLDGVRLGQGGGHYDRKLSALRKSRQIVAIGLAWECQIADELPRDRWDERLDFLLTPNEIIETR